MRCSRGDAGVVSGLVDTVGQGEDGTNWDSSTENMCSAACEIDGQGESAV